MNWKVILGDELLLSAVNDLDLPSTDVLWKQIKKMKEDQQAAISSLGLIGLFREALLDSVGTCPVAHVPYLIQVVDTSVVKQFAIQCPIVDTEKDKYALLIQPGTIDTTITDMETAGMVPDDTIRVALRLGGGRKLFGGGKFKNHGDIDLDARRSWETRTR